MKSSNFEKDILDEEWFSSILDRDFQENEDIIFQEVLKMIFILG